MNSHLLELSTRQWNSSDHLISLVPASDEGKDISVWFDVIISSRKVKLREKSPEMVMESN